MTAAGLQVDDAFLTRKQQGEKAAREEAMRLTRGKSGPERDIGVKTAIAVATKCDFTLEKHRDEVVFAECVGSSVKFAGSSGSCTGAERVTFQEKQKKGLSCCLRLARSSPHLPGPSPLLQACSRQ